MWLSKYNTSTECGRICAFKPVYCDLQTYLSRLSGVSGREWKLHGAVPTETHLAEFVQLALRAHRCGMCAAIQHAHVLTNRGAGWAQTTLSLSS